MDRVDVKKSDRILVKACRLYYEEGLSKTEIADILRISITHVNRLLKEAGKKGIVRVTINAPRFENVELDLIKKFNLKDAKVVAFSEDEQFARIDLGAEAAKYFESNVKDGDKIGIGSGKTMYELVKILKEQPRKVMIYPLASITEKDSEIKSINAFTLINTLWFKMRPTARAYKMEMFFPHKSYKNSEEDVIDFKKGNIIKETFLQILNLDFYFFSVSQIREESQIVGILNDLGTNSDYLRKCGIVGDILFNTMDKSGNHVPCGIENLILTLKTEQLRNIAASSQKNVVLVAGGNKKFEIVRSVLNAKLFNILVTDDKTATRLLTNHN